MSQDSPLTYRPLAAPFVAGSSVGHRSGSSGPVPRDALGTQYLDSISFSSPDVQQQQQPSYGGSNSGTAAAKTIVRPLQRLRNEEITAVRHEIPAVYEALVQYDSLYLNAEARVEAKENELARCIEVGQEVLLQLHAVRQRCAELGDERDAALEAQAIAERQANSLRHAMKQVERSYEDQYRSASSDAAQSLHQMKYELQQERELSSSLKIELNDRKCALQRCEDEIAMLQRQLSASEKLRFEQSREYGLVAATVAAREKQDADDAVELTQCAALCTAISAQCSAATASGASSSSPAFTTTTIHTVRDVHSFLEEVHRALVRAADLRRTNDANRSAAEEALRVAQSQRQIALEDAATLRMTASELRAANSVMAAEVEKLKAQRIDSPKRAQMMQVAIAEKDAAIADLHRDLDSALRETANRQQRIVVVESQLHALQDELQRRRTSEDFESRAMEATHRLKIAEGTIAQLQAELKRQREASEEAEQRMAAMQATSQLKGQLLETEGKLEAYRRETESLKREMSESVSEVQNLRATVSALQADLYDAQVRLQVSHSQQEKLSAELDKATSEVARLDAGKVLAVDLKALKEENASLRDALVSIQRESKELQAALSRVALEEQSVNAAALSRTRALETELEETKRQLMDLQSVERHLRQQTREQSATESQLKEMLEEQKRRMGDFLQSHTPSIMFQELEKDFQTLRDELHRTRAEALALQDAKSLETKLRTAAEEEASVSRKKVDGVVEVLRTLISLWATAHEHISELKSSASNAKVSSTHSRGGSRSAPSAAGTKGRGSAMPSSQPIRKLLFTDPSIDTSADSTLDTSLSPVPPPSHSSSGAGARAARASGAAVPAQQQPVPQRTRSVATFASPCVRRMVEAFSEAIGEQRLLAQSIVERLLSHRVLPPDCMVHASTPESATTAVIKLIDATRDTVETLGDQAAHATEGSLSKASAMEAELQELNGLVHELRSQASLQAKTVSDLSVEKANVAAELDQLRRKCQQHEVEQFNLQAACDAERQKRTKLEQTLQQMEGKLDAAQSDVQFETKSLSARCEQLREQLQAERQDHKQAIARLFEELSVAKQERVRTHQSAQDDNLAEVRRRRAAEQERDELRARCNSLDGTTAELQERVSRYAEMLQTAREEIERTHVTLNDVEASLQQELRNAEEELRVLHSQNAMLESKLSQLSVERDTADRLSKESRASLTHEGVVQQRLSASKRELEDAQARLAEASHIIASLEQRCELQNERIRQLEALCELENNEVAALREANRVVEDRLAGVELEREPLRQQLHLLLRNT